MRILVAVLVLAACGDNDGLGVDAAIPIDAAVVIDGAGAPATLALTVTSHDFGTVVEGQTASLLFTLTNTGDQVTGAPVATLDDPSWSITSPPCGMLQPHVNCSIVVAFAPTVAGSSVVELSIEATPGGQVSTSLSGFGLAAVSDAQLEVGQTLLDFGTTSVGATTLSQSITLTNAGGLPTGALAITHGGADPSQFTVVSDLCTGATLQPAAACAVTVEFAPTIVGTESATLSWTASPGGIVTVATTGTGALGGLVILPASKDFGSIPANTTSAPQSFVVTNVGGTTTGPLSQSLGGANASQFAITSSTCLGATLQPTASCTIDVTFAPTILGDDVAELDVTASPGGSVSAGLHGAGVTGELAVLSISPSQLDFGPLGVDEQTAVQPFVVTNIGTATSGALTQSLGGPNASEFNIPSSTCDGATLAPGASCTIGVRFAPTIGGSDQASLDVSALPGGTATANLTGVAVIGPGLMADKSFLQFADTEAGQVSAPQTITVTNGLNIATTVVTSAFFGSAPTQFAVMSDSCTGNTVGPGAQCAITLAFAPTDDAPGVKNATLSVSATFGGGFTVALSGTALAVPAQLSISPAAIDFGDVAAGDAVSATFTVTNDGEVSTGTLTTASSNGADFATLLDSCNGATLSSGGSCSITVEFAPITVGPHAESVTVSGAGAVTEPVSGNAIANGAFVAITGSEVFDATAVGQVSASRVITVSNIGVVTTGVLASELTDASDFTIVADTCTGATLDPGDDCTIAVAFSPAHAGARSGSLELAASPGGVASAGLSGTAL